LHFFQTLQPDAAEMAQICVTVSWNSKSLYPSPHVPHEYTVKKVKKSNLHTLSLIEICQRLLFTEIDVTYILNLLENNGVKFSTLHGDPNMMLWQICLFVWDFDLGIPWTRKSWHKSGGLLLHNFLYISQ
jgi:hypothetical protein